jgi:hypothetical protein
MDSGGLDQFNRIARKTCNGGGIGQCCNGFIFICIILTTKKKDDKTKDKKRNSG